MGWAEKRIEAYKQGKDATWVEKRALEHANSVHRVLRAIGVIALIYGLWIHCWVWIAIGIAFNGIGHLYCWLKK